MSNQKGTLAIVIKWLSDKFKDYKVSNIKDESLPDRFMVVVRDGGERRDIVLDVCDVLISIYDKNSAEACAATADTIADSIRELLGVEDITKVRINSIYEDNDTKTRFFRVEVSATIFYRR